MTRTIPGTLDLEALKASHGTQRDADRAEQGGQGGSSVSEPEDERLQRPSQPVSLNTEPSRAAFPLEQVHVIRHMYECGHTVPGIAAALKLRAEDVQQVLQETARFFEGGPR